MEKKVLTRQSMLTAVSALMALLCAGRIFLLLRAEGNVYTMGIFPMALLFGLYSLWRKGLFLEEVFFPVPMRIFLAGLFTALQVYGLRASHPGLTGIFETLIWTVCLVPLTFAGQNQLFSLAGRFGKNEEGRERSTQTGQGKKQFFCAFGIIFAGFCIPFAAYYPAIMAYDVIPQLDQIRSSGLTTHHPLIHTLFLAGCLKIGEVFSFFVNSDRAGLAVYSVLQMAAVAACFAYVYTFLRKKGVNRLLCYAFVLCAAVFPTHGMLAVSITKDTIYGALVMVFTVLVWELSSFFTKKKNPGRKLPAGYVLVSLLLLLFRNNSVYAWVLYVITAAAFSRRQKTVFRKSCAFHGGILLLYFVVNGLLIHAAAASSDTYAREMLSVPAQQIARVVQNHEEELTPQDLEAISAVWGEALPEYVPSIADRSKRDIRGDKETLRIFAGEWISLGFRYPGDYLQAFMLKNKGMWDLTDTTYLNDVYSYAKGYLQITYPSNQQEYMEALAPGYERHQHLLFLQSFYRYFAAGDELWRYCPPLALAMQPAFYCYLLLFYCLCCIGLKRKEALLPAIYLLGLLLTLLMGPCVLTRYLYPVMLSVTVLVLLLFGPGRAHPLNEAPADTRSKSCPRQ